jgi:hypothetical protein
MKQILCVPLLLVFCITSCKKNQVVQQPTKKFFVYYVQGIDVNGDSIQSPMSGVYSDGVEQVSMTTVVSESDAPCDCKAHPEDARCKTMPLTITDLSVVTFNGYNKLTWHVAGEYNILYYSIMRSPNGKNFVEVSKVKASGLSVYTFKDSYF